VEQQRRQDGAVALALDRVLAGRCEQVARLMIADRRRLAFAAFGLRPLDAFDRVVSDGVLLTEIFEQRGQPVPDRRAAERALAQFVAPGDQMRASRCGIPSGRWMPAKRMKFPFEPLCRRPGSRPAGNGGLKFWLGSNY
jgi:hypothetical protein